MIFVTKKKTKNGETKLRAATSNNIATNMKTRKINLKKLEVMKGTVFIQIMGEHCQTVQRIWQQEIKNTTNTKTTQTHG